MRHRSGIGAGVPPSGLGGGIDCRLDALPGRDLPGGLRVAEAHTRAARLKGLAKLDAMPESTALHIPKCWSVHTFTMRFPLDLIWLARDGSVVRIDENVPPRRLRTCVAGSLGGRSERGTAARVRVCRALNCAG